MRITHWQLFVFIVCLLAVLFALAMVVKGDDPNEPNAVRLPPAVQEVVDHWLEPYSLDITITDSKDPNGVPWTGVIIGRTNLRDFAFAVTETWK